MTSRSFAFTIRPKNGFTEKTEEAVLVFLKKQHHAFAVIEGEEETRHCHGQIWFEKQKTKGDLNKSLERLCERTVTDWSPAEVRVLRGGTKFAYNDDFVDNYCQKESHPNIIFNNPPHASEEYYPSQEEQTKIQESANAVDKKFHRWLVDFKESKFWIHDEWLPAIQDCAKFLAHQMFVAKKYPVIVEKRKRVEYCKCLQMYACESIKIEEFMTQEEHQKYISFLENKLGVGTQTE